MSTDKLAILKTVRRLITEVAHQVEVADAGTDPNIDYWERAYSSIFDSGKLSLIALIREELTKLDLREPDYYDPDTSYEEDVRAYANSMAEFKDQIQGYIDMVQRTGELHAEDQ